MISDRRNKASLPLTERQADVLLAIKGYIVRHGYPPTLREIGDMMGIHSTNGVADHLSALTTKGYIERPRALISRGIKLTDKAASYRTLSRRG